MQPRPFRDHCSRALVYRPLCASSSLASRCCNRRRSRRQLPGATRRSRPQLAPPYTDFDIFGPIFIACFHHAVTTVLSAVSRGLHRAARFLIFFLVLIGVCWFGLVVSNLSTSRSGWLQSTRNWHTSSSGPWLCGNFRHCFGDHSPRHACMHTAGHPPWGVRNVVPVRIGC